MNESKDQPNNVDAASCPMRCYVSDADIKTIAGLSKKQCAIRWHILNRWDWPSDFGDKELRNREGNPRRSALMRELMAKAGKQTVNANCPYT